MWKAGSRIEAAQMRRIRSAQTINGRQSRHSAAWERCQDGLAKIRTLFIGGWDGSATGGLNGWISFGLHYRALLPRALVFFLLFAALDWNLANSSLLASLAKSFALLVLAGYASLLSLRVVVDILEFGGLGRITAAMALPIGVMGVAAYLLFFNDQGRELGLGLMDKNFFQFAVLFFVLIYWAVSAWLSARIRLNRTFTVPQHHQIFLFWGPRLVGVLAHFLAACSLSFAALKDTKLTDTSANVLLAFAAPGAIALAVLFVWFLEHALLSHRGDIDQRTRARQKMLRVAAAELTLLIALGLALWWDLIPSGLFLGTLAIALSAMGFLGLISWLRSKPPLGHGALQEERRRDTLAESRNSWQLAWTLSAIMLAGTAAIWTSPMWVGRQSGSLIIAFFAFGSFLSGVNLLDLAADALAQDCKRRGFTTIQRHTVWCVFVGLLVAPAILMSATRTYHHVRLCGQCTPAPQQSGMSMSAIAKYDERPSVTEAAQAWYRQAAPIYHAIRPGEPVPLFIIATAGGGIRAAYWTATVLESLEEHLGTEAIKAQIAKVGYSDNDGLMRPLLFAISGVSGGSVGAAAYATAVHNHLVTNQPVRPTSYLKGDLLAPGLASLAFIDIPSNFLPDFGQIDRGDALERGFEDASSGLLSHSFVSFFPQTRSSQGSLKWRPALLLNATHQETGRRIITSHLRIDQDTFVDSYDALTTLRSDIRLSTAAHNSARFTYISPAGDLIDPDAHPHGFVIDGGYFENYGAQTAVELAHKAIDAIKKIEGASIRPVILQISSDPTMVEGNTLVRQRCSGHDREFLEPYKARSHWWDLSLFNELRAPMIGIMSVREAHGFAAVNGLAQLCCEAPSTTDRTGPITDINDAATSLKSAAAPPMFVHLAMCKAAPGERHPVNPPLGWVLSKATEDRFTEILGRCGNERQLTELVRALGGPATPTAPVSNKVVAARS
jgi:hypothetical protein